MRPAVLVAALLVGAPLAGCTSSETASDESLRWRFTDTDGREHSNGSAAGSPTVLFFMATWCSSCKALVDDVRAVHEDYAGDGVDVFSLSWDPDEGDEDLRDWKADYDQDWPHGNDPNLDVARTMDVESQSSVVVLDGENRKAAHWGYGEATASGVSATLDGLLEG